MEKKKKSIIVEKNVYVTKDGKEFDIESDAQFHEDILNDKKRICSNCNGKGYINERAESVWVNTLQNIQGSNGFSIGINVNKEKTTQSYISSKGNTKESSSKKEAC
jgi:hypothetical protein